MLKAHDVKGVKTSGGAFRKLTLTIEYLGPMGSVVARKVPNAPLGASNRAIYFLIDLTETRDLIGAPC